MILNSNHKRAKIYILLSIFILSTTLVFSQKKNALHVGITEGVYMKESIFRELEAFSKTDIQLGIQFELESSKLNVFGVYQLLGNVNIKPFSNFLFASQLLGVGVEHRFNKDKRLSLILGANALTEIYTNYRNGYINGFSPAYPSENHSDHFYHSTPFASSLWIGVDFLITKGLHVNLSLENNIRIIKKRYLKWELTDFEDSSMEDAINAQEIQTIILDKLGLRLGLSYNFSFN